MRTFDYETAWLQLARPMFDALPQNVRDLYARVVVECSGLSQGKNLDMPWPVWDGTRENLAFQPKQSLRQCFDEMPSEVLAQAARVIYFYGHWWPGAAVAGSSNPDKSGGGWKFSNYADQSLAARIHETLDPGWPSGGNGISFRILKGFIRAQCSTPDSWTWREVGLGTLSTWEKIQRITRPVVTVGQIAGRTRGTSRRAGAAWDEFATQFETYAAELKTQLRPAGRIAEFLDSDNKYMVDETEIKARHARAIADDPKRLERARASVLNHYSKTVSKAGIQRDGLLWLIDHGIDTENAIYYDHTKRWCFGWREPLTGEALSKLLDVVSDFPFEYDIERATGAQS